MFITPHRAIMEMFASGEQMLSVWNSEGHLFARGGCSRDQFYYKAYLNGVGVYADAERSIVKCWDEQFFREERVVLREKIVFEENLSVPDVFKVFGVSMPGGFDASGAYWRGRVEVDVLKLSGTSGVNYHWAIEANAHHRELLRKWVRASVVARFQSYPRNLVDIDGEVAAYLRRKAKAHARLRDDSEQLARQLAESRAELEGIIEFISEQGAMSLFEAMASRVEGKEPE